ncbi:hypothetical protein PENSPDRAFT_41237 [Peniophora sp. CONT]|nr:hypothetical protein PENSPDRAFT_41237 [Peniophora sp. CONT]
MQALRFGLYYTSEPGRRSSSSSSSSPGASGSTQFVTPSPAYLSTKQSLRYMTSGSKSTPRTDSKTSPSRHAHSPTMTPPPSHPSSKAQAPPGYSEAEMGLIEDRRDGGSSNTFYAPRSTPIMQQAKAVAPMDATKPKLTPKERRNAKRDALVPKYLRIPILAFSCNSASFAMYLPAIFICECGEH